MTSVAKSSRALAALILPTLLSLSLLTLGCRERAWEVVDAGPPARKMVWRTLNAVVLDIWSPDGKCLWAVGSGGFLIHSRDSGSTWELRDSGTKERLNVVSGTPDGQMIWAAGTNGTFIRSSDGGATWSVVAVEIPRFGFPAAELVGLHGSREGREIRVFGSRGEEYRSLDGGAGWLASDLGALRRSIPRRSDARVLHVAASRDGRQFIAAVSPGVLFESHDEGKTYKHLNSPADISPWRVSLTEDGSELWLIGRPQPPGKLALWHGKLTGSGWNFQHSAVMEDATSLFIEPEGKRLWVATLDGRLLNNHFDFSKQWTERRPPLALSWFGMSVGADSIWLVGRREAQSPEQVVARSRDRGGKWVFQKILGSQRIFHSGTPALTFLDRDGFLQRCDPHCRREHLLTRPRLPDLTPPPRGTGQELWYLKGSEIWISKDAGRTWLSDSPHQAKNLQHLFRSRSGFWLQDSDGIVFRSPDGRSPWERFSAPPPKPGTDPKGGLGASLFVADTEKETFLFIVDINGRIFKRRVGAEVWRLVHEIGESGIYSIKGTPDGRQLWVGGFVIDSRLGHDYRFYRSGDSGRTWQADEEFNFGNAQPLTWEISPTSQDVWALVSASGLIHGRATGAFPRVTHARLAERPPGFSGTRLELRVEGRPERIHLKGGGERDFSLDQLQAVSDSDLKVIPPQKGSDAWAIEFDPESQVVGVEEGENLYAEVTLESTGFRQAFTLPALSYKPWRPHPLIAGYAAWLAFLALLLGVWPEGLLKLQRALRVFDVSRLLDTIPTIGPAATFALGTAGALPLFVRTGRALDTWVRAHRDAVRQRFEAEETVLRSGGYVPLPARIENPENGSLLDRPDAPAISRLSRRRTLIQIVGVGGAGKTMLAVQIARWALAGKDEGGLERKPMLPVLIDEDTEDLRAVVKRKLTSWLQEEVGDELLDALLRKQRVLVIVDRVSERQRATREHLRTLHGGQPVNALVVTTRQPLDFEAGGDVRVYPQPLESETLLHFMTSLLQEPARAGAFAKMGDQLELGKKLADLIRLGAEEVPLTPLLVRLYVDKAVELARRPGASLNELPGSIPDVYFDYLRSVNPDTGGSADRMSNENMLRAAEVLARLALGKAFVPREVAKEEAREALAEAGWGKPEDPDPIRRLRDNGVLQETAVGTEMLLRFALDPVAEFLAAMAHARKCAGDKEAWKALFARVDAAGQRAAGFRLALRLVCHAYGERLGWAVPVEKL